MPTISLQAFFRVINVVCAVAFVLQLSSMLGRENFNDFCSFEDKLLFKIIEKYIYVFI